jgi:hypothetical protein
MMTAYPSVFVNIYPNEGGPFSLNSMNGAILECITSKDIWDQSSGTFELTLAPGGPFGPNASPQWQDIITPMSLITIGMQRAGRSRVVLIGCVRRCRVTERWQVGEGVRRAVKVTGRDFSYIFNQTNYYAQQFLKFTSGAAVGTDGALQLATQFGLKSQPPEQVAQRWFDAIMAGTTGLLAKMSFSTGPNSGRASFPDLMETLFQKYPNIQLEIPAAMNYMVVDGTWFDTLNQLFPFPWYEVFVATAESGEYGQTDAKAVVATPAPAMTPASPALICRVLPLPLLTNSSTTANPTFGIDMSAWNALPLFGLDAGAIATDLEFGDDNVRNYFVLNPQIIGAMFGSSNANNAPFMYLFGCWFDSASIERYGYRPRIDNLPLWFADPDGAIAQQNAANGNGIDAFQKLVGDLALKAVGFHEPAPLMANGGVTTNLRPDITVGSRFAASVDKTSALFEFYVRGVSHSFNFGGLSTTSLVLTRGLPQQVLNNTELMVALHTGDADRVSGEYTIGLPPGSGKPLEPLNLNTASDLIGDLAGVFDAPGQK